MSQNLITLDISSINFNSPKFKMVGGLTLDIVKIKYNWIFNATIKDAIIGEDKNGLVWFSGTWENGTWENGTWLSGKFLKGRWKGGNVYSYDIDYKKSLEGLLHINRIDISKTHFVNCTFEGGNFNYGIFGNIKNINDLTLPYEIDKDYVISNIEDYKIDNGFNSGLITGTTINIGFDTLISNNVKTIDTDSNSNLFIGGKFNSYNNNISNNIIKLFEDGTNDISFNNILNFNNEINVIKIDSNNKILVGGKFTKYGETNINRIVRFNSDGSIDDSFIIGEGFNIDVNTIDIINDKILVGGKFSTYNGITSNSIIRLNIDGSIDTSFIIGEGFNGDVNIIKVDSNNKILVGGNFTYYKSTMCNNIIRLNIDGSIDTSFINGNGFNGYINTIELYKDNKILIGGDFTNYNNILYNNIIRLYPNGSIDTSFIIGNGFNNIVNTIKADINGNILVGGNFTNYNNTETNKICKLSINGDIDKNFTNEKFNNNINTIFLNSYNKILVGGKFTSYDNIFQNYLIRLNIDGTVNMNNKSFYDSNLNTSIFISGNFVNGIFNSAYFNSGNFVNGIMNNSIWNNGSFYNGYFLDGNWYNGSFYGGDFSNGNWYNGIFYTISNDNVPRFGLNYKNKKSSVANWYNGVFSNGEFHSGIDNNDNNLVNWYNGEFNNGQWYGGTFNYGTFNNGIINNGIINYIIFNNGYILDVLCNSGVFNNGFISGGMFENVTFENVNLGYEIN